MAYKEKDTKKWTAQWFETNAKGEKNMTSVKRRLACLQKRLRFPQ